MTRGRSPSPLAATRDDVIQTVTTRLDGPGKSAAEAPDFAEAYAGNIRSVSGCVQALTRLNQRTPWQDGRFVLDRAPPVASSPRSTDPGACRVRPARTRRLHLTSLTGRPRSARSLRDTTRARLRVSPYRPARLIGRRSVSARKEHRHTSFHHAVNTVTAFRHRQREFVCAHRPLRDAEGHVVSLPTLVLNNPETAARALTPLLAQEPVEVFAIACLSVRKRLLAWHVCSRGSRTGTQVSMPDVFVPAVLTPGTTGLIVLHNHPSGEVTPSVDPKLPRQADTSRGDSATG